MTDIGLCLMRDEDLLFGSGKDEMIKAGAEIITSQLDIKERLARDIAAKVFVVMYLIMLSQPGDD